MLNNEFEHGVVGPGEDATAWARQALRPRRQAMVEDKYAPELNPNVAMEWGWMRGLGRRVLYLVEQTFTKKRADWSGSSRHPSTGTTRPPASKPASANGSMADRRPFRLGHENNLGTALRALGARESGTARLEEAVAATAVRELQHLNVKLPDLADRKNVASLTEKLARRGGCEKGQPSLVRAGRPDLHMDEPGCAGRGAGERDGASG